MKKILLPTDFSECSENAIKYALDFFRGETCNFYLLSIYKAWEYTTDDLMRASAGDSVYDSLIHENKQKLDALIDELKKGTGDQRYIFEPVTGYDVFTDAINQAIELNDIDLIVMGTDGATGAKEAIFGSHTVRVIRKVNCPLLVVPISYTFSKLKKVLFTIDYNHGFDESSAEELDKLLGKHKAGVEILKMCTPEAKEEEVEAEDNRIKEAFRDIPTEFHKICDVPTADAINSIVQVMKIDLNLMPVKREEFLKRLIFGSAVSKIIYTTKVPLFIVHEAE